MVIAEVESYGDPSFTAIAFEEGIHQFDNSSLSFFLPVNGTIQKGHFLHFRARALPAPANLTVEVYGSHDASGPVGSGGPGEEGACGEAIRKLAPVMQ